MSGTVLIAAGLGLAAAWPIAGVASLVGRASERLTRDPAWRERAWGLGLVLAPAAAAGTPALAALTPEAAGAAAPLAALAAAGTPVVAVSPELASAAAWLAGVVLAAAVAGGLWAIWKLAAATRWSAQAVARSRPAEATAVVRALSEAKRLGLQPPAVRVSAEVLRPLLVGLRRPVILLPEALADRNGEPLLMICRHELAHWQRSDGLRLGAEELVLGVFWFVPPLRGLRRRAAAAREECCDARALRGASAAERRLYAQTLIDALRLRAGPEPQTAFTGAGQQETAMRLNAVLNPAAPARRRTAAVLCGLTLAAAGATALGSAALAQGASRQTERNSVHSYTSRTDAKDVKGSTDVNVTVLADAHEDTPDGRAISSGNVEIEVRGAPAGMIEVDGRPQPAGFDPRSLKGRIARVESRGAEGDEPVFNIVTR